MHLFFGIEDCQVNKRIEQKQVLKMWDNYIAELYDRTNRPEIFDFQPEKEVDIDEKGPYILQSEVGKNHQCSKG
jgi:hypothetical protein